MATGEPLTVEQIRIEGERLREAARQDADVILNDAKRSARYIKASAIDAKNKEVIKKEYLDLNRAEELVMMLADYGNIELSELQKFRAELDILIKAKEESLGLGLTREEKKALPKIIKGLRNPKAEEVFYTPLMYKWAADILEKIQKSMDTE